MTDTSREAAERELIDYLDAEAEHEIECAQEMTDLGKQLRRHETTARRLVRERDALEAKLAEAVDALEHYTCDCDIPCGISEQDFYDCGQRARATLAEIGEQTNDK